jgi:hypothetical protein
MPLRLSMNIKLGYGPGTKIVYDMHFVLGFLLGLQKLNTKSRKILSVIPLCYVILVSGSNMKHTT